MVICVGGMTKQKYGVGILIPVLILMILIQISFVFNKNDGFSLYHQER